MVVVLAILGIVIAALTQLFVSASTAQVDMTRRFEAQQEMRLALDKLRREIHCANGVTGAPPTSSIVISLGSYCPTNKTGAVAQVTWCTKDKSGALTNPASPAANPPYALWRYNGNACSGTGRREADYLTTGQVFTAYAPPTAGSGSLGKLSVHLPVDVKPADAKQRYVLEDDIVLRNTPRQ
jgi:type II secretory pathway pseudopilin PulG